MKCSVGQTELGSMGKKIKQASGTLASFQFCLYCQTQQTHPQGGRSETMRSETMFNIPCPPSIFLRSLNRVVLGEELSFVGESAAGRGGGGEEEEEEEGKESASGQLGV